MEVKVKHIIMPCPLLKCDNQAFLQVVVVPEKEMQPKIDAYARLKLVAALKKAHKEGEHNA